MSKWPAFGSLPPFEIVQIVFSIVFFSYLISMQQNRS